MESDRESPKAALEQGRCLGGLTGSMALKR